MNDMPIRDVILVGLDHTPAGSAALRWAVDEGVRREARVMAIHVYDRDRADLMGERDHESAKAQDRIESHRQLIDVVGDDAWRVGVAIAQREGPVAVRLAEAAEHAVLVVVGRPSDLAHRDLPEELLATCSRPVVVVDESGVAEELEPPCSSNIA